MESGMLSYFPVCVEQAAVPPHHSTNRNPVNVTHREKQ
ncbi:MAG: hypothetical protein FD173_1359 [Gallionellaceae bacterium]|nr:MAG: hypothetical protein FD173_1359 [Gallionellaceae bacterium]